MLKTASITVALLICLVSANAQYKIGGIDVDQIWEYLPKSEVMAYESAFKQYQDSLITEYEKMQKIINKETEKFLAGRSCNAPPLPESEINFIRERFIALLQKISNFESGVQKLIEQKSKELKNKIYDKIKEQIKPIAFEMGYDIIIDLCAYKIFPLPHCNNVTVLVLKKLGWKQ